MANRSQWSRGCDAWLGAQQVQQFVVKDEGEFESERDAEHQEEWEVRRADQLPEHCRQNAEQRQGTQYKTDDGLQDYEE